MIASCKFAQETFLASRRAPCSPIATKGAKLANSAVGCCLTWLSTTREKGVGDEDDGREDMLKIAVVVLDRNLEAKASPFVPLAHAVSAKLV